MGGAKLRWGSKNYAGIKNLYRKQMIVIQGGKKLEPEGGCSDLPKLDLLSLGLYFNLAAVAIARGL